MIISRRSLMQVAAGLLITGPVKRTYSFLDWPGFAPPSDRSLDFAFVSGPTDIMSSPDTSALIQIVNEIKRLNPGAVVIISEPIHRETFLYTECASYPDPAAVREIWSQMDAIAAHKSDAPDQSYLNDW